MGASTNKERAMEAFDGIMLGDSSIQRHGRYARMRIAKSGIQYMPYLVHLRDMLGLLGIEFCAGHPKYSKAVSKGKPYTYCYLTSITSSFLLEQYNRWYQDGGGAIPNDVRVTPFSMAYMFMDDGYTSWKQGNCVDLCICTDCFNKEDVYRLKDLMEVAGVHFTPRPFSKARPNHIRLRLRRIDEVNRFLDLVEPYILPCYMYKVKRPRSKEQMLQEARTPRELKELNEFNALRSELRDRRQEEF